MIVARQTRRVVPMLPDMRVRGRRGLGSANTNAQQAVQIGTTIGTPILTGVLASGAASSAAAAGTSAAILGMAPSLAIPLIGAAMVGVTLLVTTLIKNSGCGQTCIQTSQWANQAADALQKNLDAYRALPSPRSRTAQTVALNNFDAIWNQLTQMCGDPQWGDAGKRCISDRQAGSCKWKDNGQCWNWFTGYRDPIAKDANVVDDSVLGSASSLVSSLLPAGGSLPAWALPAAVLALLAVAA